MIVRDNTTRISGRLRLRSQGRQATSDPVTTPDLSSAHAESHKQSHYHWLLYGREMEGLQQSYMPLYTRKLGHLQHTQNTTTTCSNLAYTVLSSQNLTMTLGVAGTCYGLGQNLTVYMEMLLCPAGFELFKIFTEGRNNIFGSATPTPAQRGA